MHTKKWQVTKSNCQDVLGYPANPIPPRCGASTAPEGVISINKKSNAQRTNLVKMNIPHEVDNQCQDGQVSSLLLPEYVEIS